MWSILTSFDRAAYYVLWIKGLQIICWPLDLILSLVERPFLRKEADAQFPTIFVVGIHRTGSTFVSQVLADGLGFAPLGNFSTIFPRSRHLIHVLFKRFYDPSKPGKAQKYRSFYGISRGFFSIGDSYEVWDRWFGKDHYNRPDQLSPEAQKSMREYFTSVQSAWGLPMITKNNRNSLILEMIYKTVPNAFFVLVNRNPADVIQSTMNASKDFFGTDEIIWGLRDDKRFSPVNYKDKLDAYCHQHIDLEDAIEKEINKLPDEDYLEVQYEKFCEKPNVIQKELLDKLKSKYHLPEMKKGLGNSRYYTSKRLYDAQLTAEINRRMDEIKSLGSAQSGNG